MQDSKVKKIDNQTKKEGAKHFWDYTNKKHNTKIVHPQCGITHS